MTRVHDDLGADHWITRLLCEQQLHPDFTFAQIDTSFPASSLLPPEVDNGWEPNPLSKNAQIDPAHTHHGLDNRGLSFTQWRRPTGTITSPWDLLRLMNGHSLSPMNEYKTEVIPLAEYDHLLWSIQRTAMDLSPKLMVEAAVKAHPEWRLNDDRPDKGWSLNGVSLTLYLYRHNPNIGDSVAE